MPQKIYADLEVVGNMIVKNIVADVPASTGAYQIMVQNNSTKMMESISPNETGGPSDLQFVTDDADTTILDSTYYLFLNSPTTATRKVNLPDPTVSKGRVIHIVNQRSEVGFDENTVPFRVLGDETQGFVLSTLIAQVPILPADNVETFADFLAGQVLELYSDGAKWVNVAGYQGPGGGGGTPYLYQDTTFEGTIGQPLTLTAKFRRFNGYPINPTPDPEQQGVNGFSWSDDGVNPNPGGTWVMDPIIPDPDDTTGYGYMQSGTLTGATFLATSYYYNHQILTMSPSISGNHQYVVTIS